ncbi:hypothetical protein CFN78_19550 [Amycolatopsis antarctica]|uniref:Uncharacterized protein n=1 Tax=Amycolatopsis antarctica TaxID=1854586 RepID=A0A263CYY1_9PSEU|nr:hypothetical protein [Amycolatopsis antarctica]OZM71363.1 hypothetical protein CFN78_19550 [Amycolatopsis antarctica]
MSVVDAPVRTVRLPGRPRFLGIFSGDSATFVALFTGGLLISAFFRLDAWRSALLGDAPGDPRLVVPVLLLGCALAWRSLLRRAYVWADPAELTWFDFGGADRVRVIGGRLWSLWTGWVAGVGYLGALVAAVYRAPAELWVSGGVLLAGCATLMLATARLPRTPLDTAGPFVLAAFAVLSGLIAPPSGVFLAAGALLGGYGLALLVRSGSPWRPVVARLARREGLVGGWRQRVVRTVAMAFDPLMMLPESGAVGVVPIGSPTRARFAWLGVRGRSRYLATGALLAVAVALVHAALPALPAVVLLACGGYLALAPCAAGLGEVWRSPGLRRWLGWSDLELRLWHGAVYAALAGVWLAIVLAVSLLLGASLPVVGVAVVPLVTAAVLRTVTRPPITYHDMYAVQTGFGAVPGRLVKQAVRGPDAGVAGLVAVTSLPLGLPTVLVVAAVTAFCLLR